ncbi:Cysteine-rich RLK (RECEPTOR-like protein kinase) 8 [Cucumis melo var. makuwa]|uniref:Cysteine-rich RLK (RECEPTOR-like protein kinase) 8 n=1 Tax=Cucumis melo var. makuwa TaxID=1194695 RepID=A0A5D3CY23_CUCMM|nr:Cysteine-rich RLK (RECEPTOR-like protein kinase) 8 [Cucumis melo var. makuwa]
MSRGKEKDDLFLYTLTSPTPSPALPSTYAPNRPPIPNIYSSRQQPQGECFVPKDSLLSNSGPGDDLAIALRKVNPNGSIACLKACLVAKGYAKTYGVDYFAVFSPIAKLPFVRGRMIKCVAFANPCFGCNALEQFGMKKSKQITRKIGSQVMQYSDDTWSTTVERWRTI